MAAEGRKHHEGPVARCRPFVFATALRPHRGRIATTSRPHRDHVERASRPHRDRIVRNRAVFYVFSRFCGGGAFVLRVTRAVILFEYSRRCLHQTACSIQRITLAVWL